ncbi:MAG: 3-dehydroquinate synthase II [Proteobacteria bacterium]|nr:3-dehydroquinate synthase II [Pseudomonadota bacterium]
MKTVWIKVVPFRKELITTALESGADGVLVPKGYSEKVKKLGIIKTIAEDGDLKLGDDVVEWEIKGKEDEAEIIKLSKSKLVIVKSKDWTIIPLENLLAQTSGLIAEVKDNKEAQTVTKVLERGVDGILLNSQDIQEIKTTIAALKSSDVPLNLIKAKIRRIEPLGMGDRVCVDTCTNMGIGEGMLIGNSSSGMFLVHSESPENPYVEPRPFRVNAGPVHAYVSVPGGKTRYLSELKAGDEISIINYQGTSMRAVVGRIKVERRPLMLIEAETGGKIISTILQNAETIRLTQPDGTPLSVVELKKGSEILVYLEDAGRHFGMKIKETIVEK